MNRISNLPLLLLAIFVLSCSSENGEDLLDELKADCTQSDLTLVISEQLEPTCTESGQVTVTASGGLEPYSYQLENNTSQSTGLFENLLAGDYNITVTDDNGCESALLVSLISEDGFTASAQTAGCGNGDGTITVTANGTGTYMYSLDAGTPQASNSFEQLDVGEYDVTVTDQDACIVTIPDVAVGVGLARDIMPIITANCALSNCHGGSQNPNLSTATNIIASANRIKARTEEGTMPPSQALSPALVELITEWVDCGANNN